MAFAAVPDYLQGAELANASPGLRFGMYLPIWKWGDSGALEKATDRAPLLSATKLMDHARLLTMLRMRQRAVADAGVDALLRLEARAVAPFTTGLGNEHPLENGFAFLSPYGLPYLAGSGVKGVLRRAAQELQLLAQGGWGNAGTFRLQIGKKSVDLDAVEVLFGRESGDLDAVEALFGHESGDDGPLHVRGTLTFWDVLPQLAGDTLLLDVMTPHQSHYLQDKEAPHDSGKLNPITFLTVPPDSAFTFHVSCDRPRLARIAPALAEDDAWRTLLHEAFEYAFQWLGFGAKTAVGYGAMARDARAEADAAERARELAERREREARRATMSERERRVQDYIELMQRRFAELRGGTEAPNQKAHTAARDLARAAAGDDWTAAEKHAAADAIEAWLPKVVRVEMKEERKKLGLRALRGEK